MGVLDNVKLHFVESTDDIAAFMSWLGERRTIMAIDSETSGFNARAKNAKLRLWQFGDHVHGWAIDVERWRGLPQEVLTKYEGDLVAHNAPFEAKWSAEHLKVKLPWSRMHDTMTAAHILNPLRPKGLKPLAAKLVDARAIGAQRQLDEGMATNKWDWATVPTTYRPYWAYGALDTVLTCHVADAVLPDVLSGFRESYELEMGTLAVVTSMMIKGARINPEYCNSKTAELMAWNAEARAWLTATYGIKNATSNAQVIAVLQSEGIEFTERTPAGQWKLDKDVLRSIDHPIARYVLAIRKIEKNVQPYFRNFLEMMDEDEVLHPSIWSCGTRTGRMSITEPALQTLPRRDPTVRTAFRPREGNALITIDADQIEARLMAHFSGDQGLIDAFHADADFFCVIASTIYGQDILKGMPQRDLTKNAFYGKMYGAGVPKLALTAGVPYEVMDEVNSALDGRFPGILDTQRRINADARGQTSRGQHPYVTTPVGRRLYCDEGKDYALLNYLIQGHAAEIFKRGLCDLAAAGLEDYLILPVHDEVVADVPKDQAPEVLRLMEQTLNNFEDYTVPITWGGDILDSDWGQKYR